MSAGDNISSDDSSSSSGSGAEQRSSPPSDDSGSFKQQKRHKKADKRPRKRSNKADRNLSKERSGEKQNWTESAIHNARGLGYRKGPRTPPPPSDSRSPSHTISDVRAKRSVDRTVETIGRQVFENL